MSSDMLPPLDVRHRESASGQGAVIGRTASGRSGLRRGQPGVHGVWARSRPGDRYCAECGSLLPEASPVVFPALTTAESPPAPKGEEQTWLFGSRPVAVIGGGIAL